MNVFLTHSHYIAFISLASIGLYAIIAKGNLVKKVIGLNILQTAVFLFYISAASFENGTAPILKSTTNSNYFYVDPVPHVLMLTAIVVGISLTAIAISLIVQIKNNFGTIEEVELLKKVRQEK